jgi:poly(3-hydroxybutyrate) depolymerase
MLYTLYEMQRAAFLPWRAGAKLQSHFWRSPANPFAETAFGRSAAAAADVFESVTRRYGKPEWGIDKTRIAGVEVPFTIEPVVSETWCRLLHFRRDANALAKAAAAAGRKPTEPDPRLLIVAPLSGHYATLLRGTVEAFLPNHEVYITDWSDARTAPLIAGGFDLDDYTDVVRRMITAVGPGAHVLAVCQPGPAVLAAVAMMSEDEDKALPRSMIFMGSPIDARRSPTHANRLAQQRPLSWFESNMIHTTPPPYPGAFRRVYPGFVQLASFMNMNLERHMDAHWSFFEHLVEGDDDSAQRHREFYDEYLSVLDMSAEFYLQTVQEIFQEHRLATGTMRRRGRLIRPEAIREVALMTVEGERDDISGVGQTQAAHDLCVNIPAEERLLHVHPKVGHYGVFSGTRFTREIAPLISGFIRDRFDLKSERAVRSNLRLVSAA